MKLFRRSRSGQTPPISLILVLVGFILLAFWFLAFRQLQGAQERRLRLLTGFGERVESTVENLSDRIVRIVKVEDPAGESAAQEQRDKDQVERYLEHVPHVSLIGRTPECPQGREAQTEGSVDLWASGPSARLRYCPPEEEPAEPPEEEPAEPRGYLAGIDLEGLIEPMIVPGAFDSILLADHRGQVLFQEGEPEVRILDLAPLVEASAGGGDGDDGPWWRGLLRERGADVDPDAFDRLLGEHEDRPLKLGGRTAMVEVAVAGTEYLVFLQPVSPGLEPPPRHGGGEPVRWIACGIISKENLWSAGLTTSPFLLFILVSILPLAIVSWPFLKLSLITRRQPFRRLDLASLLFASVVGLALAALLAFDLLFVHRLHATVDGQLSKLAGAIAGRFHLEVLDAREQLVGLNDSDGLWPGAGAVGDCDGTAADGIDEDPSNLGDLTPVTYIENPPESSDERDDETVRALLGRNASYRFIRTRVPSVVDSSDLSTYPYFDSVFRATWEGRHGCANLPLREHAVLPQVIDDRDYFRCARDCDPEPVFLRPQTGRGGGVDRERWERCSAHVFDRAGDGNLPVCLHSLLDRTTGTSVAALALPTADDGFPVAALVARLTSVGHPVLPPQVGFAIVERDGRVLFHSEARRDLSESFLKASDEDPVLRSMLRNRRSGHLALHYWGQPTRAHVKPLAGLPWSLVTFRNTYDLRVRNFEVIYDFLNPFLLYLGALLLVALAGLLVLPRRVKRCLWPSSEYLRLYRWIVATTVVWVALFFLAVLSAGSGLVLGIAAAGPLALAAAATGALQRMGSREDEPRSPRSHRSVAALRPTHWSVRWLWTTTEKKPRWLPLVFLGVLGILASAWLVVTEARVLPVLVAGLAVGLVAALFWNRNSFWGERRKVAYVFAFGCVLLVAGLLPALGFFHLARSRQMQLHTQDAQVALARALEERERDVAGRQGPLEEDGLYEEYRNEELDETRKAYLEAVFETTYETGSAGEEGSARLEPPPWPYGIEAERPEDEEEDEDEQVEEEDQRAGWVARLLSARPFPLNDLSARPVESDLSRFDAEVDWGMEGPRRPVLIHRTHDGIGDPPVHLASKIPPVDTLPGLGPITVLLLLGLLLLAVGPFLLAHYLAERVLLISLVGAPRGDRRRRGTAARLTPVASTPLPFILDGVIRAEEVVKQVVLVATLPGPSAWEGLVEEGAQRRRGDRTRFRQVDFRDAWRRACLETEAAAGPAVEDGAGEESAPRTAEGDAARAAEDHGTSRAVRRSDRFYEELLGLEGEEGEAGPPEDQPLLLTHFTPALDDPEDAADQVAALQRLTREDGRSVVILAETVPDPELAGGPSGIRPRSAARRAWTELLATYSVEYGHDSRTHDIETKVSALHGRIEGLLEPDLRGDVREELHAIERSLRHIERECSPNSVLRNMGWSLLEEVEGALGSLETEIRDRERQASPSEDRRELQGEVDEALGRLDAALARDQAGQEGDGDDPKDEKHEQTGEAAEALVKALRDAHEEAQNPVVLLRRAAITVAGDPSPGSDVLDRAYRTLNELRPEEDDEKTRERDEAVSYLERAHRDLRRRELRRRRIGRARKLLQLFTREHVVSKVGTEARLHYRYLWSRCTPDEKLVLVQLSEDGLVNPKYFGWLMDLMNRGLVVRDPEVRVMNESFRRFVLQEVQRSQVREWQEEEGPSGWSVLKWILPAPLVLVAAFLFVTQRDALSNVTGVVIALVSLAPILINLYGQFRQVSAQREGAQEEGAQKEGATAGGPS